VAYAERPLASSLISCTWERHASCAGEHRVLPDACVDLIWTAGRLIVAGPDSRARLVAQPAGARTVGVRLRPGAAGAVLGLPASELRDQTPDAADVLGHDAAEALLEALDRGEDAHATLRHALERRAEKHPDPLVHAAVAALDRPHARVTPVAAELGLSARQLQRRVSDAVGYGPKMLARVLRFRRLLALGPAPFAELALDAGYADQAHMTAEVTRLAGVPPVRFFKDRRAAAA
jgi:AraC-like DNA-binding protein